MAIVLGNITFDAAHTAVHEQHAEVGGRDARTITISGLVLGASNVAAIHAALDAIVDAASVDDYTAALSLRPGRRLWVRREGFERGIVAEPLAGSFKLSLSAQDPYEEAIDPTAANWPIDHAGDTLAVAATGNTDALATITLTATGDLVNPSVSDGTRQIAYNGAVLNGSVLVFDGVTNTVTVDGGDRTPYAIGEFPRIAPEGTVLTYQDDDTSAHTASAVVSFRDRWW